MTRTSKQKYDAFISYSHAADAPTARAIESAIEKFAKPWYRLRSANVFRDETSLDVNSDLWPNIKEKLGDSEFLIILASPDASKSKWVKKELCFWLTNGICDNPNDIHPSQVNREQASKVLLVLTDGTLLWSDTDGDFDWKQTNALPHKVMAQAFIGEPLWIDMRWTRKPSAALDRDNRQFYEATGRLSAAIHDLDIESLIGIDHQEHRKTMRVFRSLTAALGIALVLTFVGAWLALRYQKDASQADADRRVAVQLEKVATTDKELAQEREKVAEAYGSISRGKSLGKAHRWKEARKSFGSAFNQLTALGKPSVGATIGVGESFSQSPLPLFELQHKQPILDIDTVPKTDLVVATTSDSLVLWDLASGESVKRFNPTDNNLTCVAISPNGEWGVSGGLDGVVTFWRLPSCETYKSLIQHPAAITSLAISSDAKQLAVGTADVTGTEHVSAMGGYSPGLVRVWDLNEYKQIYEFAAHDGSVNSIDFLKPPVPNYTNGPEDSKKYSQFVTGGQENIAFPQDGNSGELVQWSIGQKEKTRAFKGHRMNRMDGGDVLALAVSQRNFLARPGTSGSQSLLVSGSEDQTARIWDLSTGLELHRITHHDEAVSAVCFSNYPTNVLTGSQDGNAVLWDLDDQTVVKVFEHGSGINAVAFSRDDNAAMTGGDDGRLVIWNTQANEYNRLQRFFYNVSEGQKTRTPAGQINTIEVSPNDELAIVGCSSRDRSGKRPVEGALNELLKVFHVPTGLELYSFRGDPVSVLDSVWLGQGDDFAYIGTEGKLRIISSRTGSLTGECVPGDGSKVQLICGALSEPIIAGVTSKQRIAVWDTETRKLLVETGEKTASIQDMAIDDEATIIVAACEDGFLRVWNAKSGTIESESQLESLPRCIDISPDGKLVAVGMENSTLEILGIDGRHLATLRGHLDPVRRVRWIRQSRLIVSTGDDGTIRLWQPDLAEELAQLRFEPQTFFDGERATVQSLAVTTSGDVIIAGGTDTQVRVFDLSRVSKLSEREGLLEATTANLPSGTSHISAGKWLAFNGFHLWALKRFELAEKHGHSVSSETLAVSQLNLGEVPTKSTASLSTKLAIIRQRREELVPLVNQALTNIRQRKLQEAIDDCNSALDIFPDFTVAIFNRGLAHYHGEDIGKAVADWQAVVEIESRLDPMTTFSPHRRAGPASYNEACVVAKQLDPKDLDESLSKRAFQLLNQAVDLGYTDLTQWRSIKTDSDLDSLRGDNRYKKLLERQSSQSIRVEERMNRIREIQKK